MWNTLPTCQRNCTVQCHCWTRLVFMTNVMFMTHNADTTNVCRSLDIPIHRFGCLKLVISTLHKPIAKEHCGKLTLFVRHGYFNRVMHFIAILSAVLVHLSCSAMSPCRCVAQALSGAKSAVLSSSIWATNIHYHIFAVGRGMGPASRISDECHPRRWWTWVASSCNKASDGRKAGRLACRTRYNA